ncbi:hypothetical protein PTSG_11466 [Salpingoeca rosetta]|uniref:F-box domain-containing protein n=1 Tax=Salpingoeca rosetta (strain ATCC 50818 / BSB-021) TaxID=946362 RepID=F2UTJ1_SALR5|nr:uncharacterized protein PTSG_11466 [Salpingoeca rosetta]EGD83713.1 hypothetical protein PTSG_11466 [Salpingoeca rosetta]|eukprot:XP_004987512.1 hypothetical protein PTSG_11466 [Salpingoeca rosetta]
MQSLDKARSIQLSDCGMLESFAFNGAELSQMGVSNCAKLASLALGRVTRMQSFELEGCPAMQAFCCPLREADALRISDCTSLLAADLSKMQTVGILSLSQCSQLRHVVFSGQRVGRLRLLRCDRIQQLLLPKLETADVVHLADCPALVTFHVHEQCRISQQVYVRRCSDVLTLSRTLSTEELNTDMPLMSVLHDHARLRVSTLELHHQAIRDLTPLRTLPDSVQVKVFHFTPQRRREAGAARCIRELHMSVTPYSTTDIYPWGHVRDLSVSGGDATTSKITGLQDAKNVDVRRCWLAEAISNCHRLNLHSCSGKVNITRVPNLTITNGTLVLESVAHVQAMTLASLTLNLGVTHNVDTCRLTMCTIRNFSGLSGVRHLELENCSFNSIDTLPAVRRLRVHRCRTIVGEGEFPFRRWRSVSLHNPTQFIIHSALSPSDGGWVEDDDGSMSENGSDGIDSDPDREDEDDMDDEGDEDEDEDEDEEDDTYDENGDYSAPLFNE